MTLLRLAMRKDRTGILGWGIGLFLFGMVIAASFSAIDGNEEFSEALEGFGGVEDAFGVDSLTSFAGYFESNFTAFLPLLLGIYGGLAATKTFAGAEEEGRLDHLFARPISRLRFLLTHAGAIGLGQLLILLASAAGAALGYVFIGQAAGDILHAVANVLEVLPIALAHVAVAVLASVLFHRRGPAVASVMAVVVGGFAIDLASKLVSELSFLKWLNLYGYWGRSDVFHNDADPLYFVVAFLVATGAMAGAAWHFGRKDLH